MRSLVAIMKLAAPAMARGGRGNIGLAHRTPPEMRDFRFPESWNYYYCVVSGANTEQMCNDSSHSYHFLPSFVRR
jgi:hypothetical protein